MPSAMRGSEDLARVRAITMRLGGRTVLDRVDLRVRAGEIVTLVGPNGSGKTTLVRIVLGLVKPGAGEVWRRPALRIGYVPQQLQVDRTLPLTVRRFITMGRGARHDRLDEVLTEIGIGYALDQPFQDISGGEARRAMIARALLQDPELLVLDEPTANVDVAGQGEFFDLVRAIRDSRDCGVLLVSHDLHLVMAATDYVVCINGHVCCSGVPETVASDPEFLALFGAKTAASHGVYTHAHDHRHDLSGEPVGEDRGGRAGGDGRHG